MKKKNDIWEEIELLILEMTGNYVGAVTAFTEGTPREPKAVEMIIEFSRKSMRLQNLVRKAKETHEI